MAERPLTVSGLLDKRSELLTLIREAKKTLHGLMSDLDHLDRTIELFDPDGDIPLKRPKRAPSYVPAFKGEMRRYILDALREAPEPLTSLDLAKYVCRASGIDVNERKAVITVRKRVTAALTKMRERGLVAEVPMFGRFKGWRIKR